MAYGASKFTMIRSKPSVLRYLAAGYTLHFYPELDDMGYLSDASGKTTHQVPRKLVKELKKLKVLTRTRGRISLDIEKLSKRPDPSAN